ncbi:serrate RNA effector molecule homolog [Hylaeus anthracinus]|uniref:serrate RNA effector molecule homolog n=1 Tax=Hylaeus anthracinus TaxID=313031 RepID=UPI0023B990BB|nr:serrate RNA effector molecule homolog [Hylaeus anthracinus]
MGKTPKKAVPGGDERNLLSRRLLNSHKRQRQSENPNRPELSTTQKKIPQNQRKHVSSKLQAPTQSELSFIKKPLGRPPGSSKDKKLTIPDKSVEPTLENMQPESEEAEVKLDATTENEDAKKDTVKDTQESDECVDHATVKLPPDSKEQENSINKESLVVEEEQIQEQEVAEIPKEAEEHEEPDLTLSFETEDSATKTQEEKSNDNTESKEAKEECISLQSESKADIQEKEDVQSESQTDTESYSVDMLESTTSELSEVSEVVSQNDGQKEKEKVEEETHNKETSFVSYDPSIMLKDVQIKLNDCMKENTKTLDASNADYEMLSQGSREASFGKTLRSISGRRSLNRMRHVTLRDHRYSPNNSLFVNTSSASLLPDETEDFKILRYSTGLSDTISTTNGSSSERKRKYETEDWNSSKKPKTESENSLLNTSISILKGLRRPIQVSTPRSELKFQTNKLNLTEDESNAMNDGTGRKWCNIM